MRRRLLTPFVPLALLAARLLASAPSEDHAVIAEGIYDYVLPGATLGSKPLYSARYNFRIAVKDCSWVITCDPLPVDGIVQNPLEARTVSAYDGKDIYTLRFQNQEAVRQIWGKRYDSVKDTLPGAMASLFPGDYPSPEDSAVQHLWLAFASHCRLAEPRGSAKPPFAPDVSIFLNPEYASDYYWTHAPGKPEDRVLVLFSDGRILGRDAKGNLVQGRERAPYNLGYTNGIGRWSRATNIAGWRLPLLFEFTAFTPRPNGRAASELRPGYTYTCTVTNVSRGAMPEIPPRLSGERVLVSDRRLAKSGHATIPYPITNAWLLTNDPRFELLAKSTAKMSLEEEVRRGHARSPRTRVPRAIIVLCLALPFGIVIVARLIGRLRRTNNSVIK